MVIRKAAWAFVGGASGPVGTKTAGFDNDHADSQGRDFLLQGPGEADHRKLGRVVVAQPGRRPDAGQRGNVDDRATALAAHHRQGRRGHAPERKDVDLEHASHFGVLALFNRSEIADASIIDQHINPPEMRLGSFDGGLNLCLVSHIEAQDQCARPTGKVLQRFSLACADDGRVTGVQQLPNQLPAKPRRTAGDEPDRFAIVCCHDHSP